MPTPHQFETRFWKALESDATVMLGIDGVANAHMQPMLARLDGHHGPIWFFTSKNSALLDELDPDARATAAFISKAHDIFAILRGRLSIDTNRTRLDKLWNRSVAVWFERGKDDPKLRLLRLDADKAEIWLDGSNVTGVKMLLRMESSRFSRTPNSDRAESQG